MKRDTAAQQAAPTEEFSEALAAFVLPYKNFIHKTWAAKILHNQAEQVNKDPEWLYEDGPPPPAVAAVLELLQPSSAVVGDPEDVTLEVIGTGITSGSVIWFNGGAEPTTYVDETKVTTIVKPSLVAESVAVPVEVRNGDLASNSLDFEFTDPVTRKASRTKGKDKD
jgi:hypothetical protein